MVKFDVSASGLNADNRKVVTPGYWQQWLLRRESCPHHYRQGKFHGCTWDSQQGCACTPETCQGEKDICAVA